MVWKLIRPIVLVLMAISIADAGIIAQQSDAPKISNPSAVSMEMPSDQPANPHIEQGSDTRFSDVQRAESAVSVVAAIPITGHLVYLGFYLIETLNLQSANLPRPPDLDGLIKPPQTNHEFNV